MDVEEKTNLYQYIKWQILDILFPENCLGCRKRGETICDICILKIPEAERETERNIIAIYDYRDPVIKKAIWNLKYYHRLNIGHMLGKLLYENMIEEISNIKVYASGKPICIIPTPISKAKMKSRGYNQAEVIARGFVKNCEKGLFELRNDIVYKKFETKPQARISNRSARLNNIKNTFGIHNTEIIKGRTIIIIDDVTTTGGTINEIMKILKQSGAKKVVGFVIAH